MADVLTADPVDGVRTITLNRPDKLNALTDEMIGELGRMIELASADDRTRAVVLTGSGRAFCAGADLAALTDFSRSLGDRVRRHYNPVVLRLATMEKPLLAAVNGAAAGAGLSLALACDTRIAARTARFICAFVQVGLVPDCGATFFLPRLLGPARSFELAASGRPVGADEALAIGLADRIVDDGEVLRLAVEAAAKLAAGPATALALTKRALNPTTRATLAAALEVEAASQETAARASDFNEGVRAFLEKRPARFG